MSRRVDADVVLAALRIIDDGLSARDVANGALRASNARHRVRSLVQQIENQAVTCDSRVTHDVETLRGRIERFIEAWEERPQYTGTIYTLARMVDGEDGERVEQMNALTIADLRALLLELGGAGDLPAEGTMLSDAAEFAAAWNSLTVEQRAEWFVGWAKAMNDASRCVIANHDGLVHQHAALARAILKVRAGVLLDDMHEIDALPNLSVLVDRDGDVWQYRGGLWCSYETATIGSERLARKYGPVKVIALGDVS